MMQGEQLGAGVETAGFGERLVAYLIDTVLIVLIELVLMLLLGRTLGYMLSFVASIAYFIGFWTAQGATPGKIVMGLRVIRQDGNPVDGSTAAFRYVGYMISGLAIGLGFLWILWDPNKEGWHDKIAKTRVIKVAR
jgi:uncharacterized RDD family membrane protein YckC